MIAFLIASWVAIAFLLGVMVHDELDYRKSAR